MARTRRETRFIPLLLGVLAATISLLLGTGPLGAVALGLVLATVVSAVASSDQPAAESTGEEW